MALQTTTGDELAMVVDPGTKKLTIKWTNGDAAFSGDMLETVMSLLFEDESPFTTNRRRGPKPIEVPADTADAPSQMKARAEERLQLAIDDGRLQSVDVRVERIVRGKLNLRVSYVTRTGYKGMVEKAI